MNGFNTIALNENYEIISLLRYTNLQWRRKYYEPGTFSMQIPLEQYDENIKFIYTKDRPELGVVTQKNYISRTGYRYIALSGFFLENEVNNMPIYPVGAITNVINQPTWTEISGPSETVALKLFNDFKRLEAEIDNKTVTSYLDISSPTDEERGENVLYTREGGPLGEAMYDVLKESEMSYRVQYDFVNSTKALSIYKGVDRTQDNTEGNNQVKFSTKTGTITDPNILIDETNFRNGIMLANSYIVNNDTATRHMVQYKANKADDTTNRIEYVNSIISRGDYSSDAEYEEAIAIDADKNLYSFYTVINVEFDAIEGSYEYMKDFDLGDKCDIVIPEIRLEAEARLIGCYETIKDGNWTLTMEFGTPMIKNK